MNKSSFLLIALTFQVSLLANEGGHCVKCEIMKDYYKKNPSKNQYYDDYYYDDYLKDLEKKGASSADPSPEDLPPDVKFIMNMEREGPDSGAKKKGNQN